MIRHSHSSIVHRTMDVRQINEEEQTVEVIVSDESIDRHQTIFLLDGWELENYRKNPVLCWSHPLNRWLESPEPEDLIGEAVQVKVTPAGLLAKFRFAVGQHERADICWKLTAAGFLRAFSIGANILEYVDMWSEQAEIMSLPEAPRKAILSGEAYEVFTKQELIEVSQVLVGSNTNALISKAYRSGVLDRRGVDLLLPSNRIPNLSRTISTPRTTAAEAPPTEAQEAPAEAPESPAEAPAETPAPAPEVADEDPTDEEILEVLLEDDDFCQELIETLEELS